MQKVVGSSPIIRSRKAPLGGVFCCLHVNADLLPHVVHSSVSACRALSRLFHDGNAIGVVDVPRRAVSGRRVEGDNAQPPQQGEE